MRRLLVTGGAGFIGANFVHYWLREHPDDQVVVVDALTYAGNMASLAAVAQNPRYRFVRGDICDRPLIESLLREQIDTVVHFAAESHVDRSIAGPDAFIRTNVLGTHALLEAARTVWLGEHPRDRPHRFHHVSTDEVYGSLGADEPAFSEATPYAPNSPYSASKAASDHLVRAYHHTYGLCVTTSNCSNNYGPYQFPEKLIPLMLVNMLAGRPLPIYGDGRNVRDWLYVEDHCRGIDLILTAGKVGQVYNIGGRSECENLQLLETLCAIADESFRERAELRARYARCPAALGAKTATLTRFVTDRPGHDRRYAIDARKIERELGFVPSVSLEAGLRRTFAWYLANEAWWQAVMDGSYQRWIDSHYQGTASA